MAGWMRGLFGLFLVALLVACGSSSDTSQAAQYDIPATTKVTDADTRDALTAYSSADGTLHFSRSTSVLDDLSPGDVLVSGVANAAPQGFLRKVMSVQRSGSDVVVNTTQAALTDAIHRGSFDVRKKVALADIKNPQLPAGVKLQAVGGASGGLKLQSANPPPGGFNIVLDHFTISLGRNPDAGMPQQMPTPGGQSMGMVTVGGGVTLTGYVHVDPEVHLAVDIDANPFPYMRHFLAGIELNEGLDQQIDAQLTAGYKFEATYTFTLGVFDIQIGYVPVIVVPTLDLTVGVAGTASVNISFHAVQGNDLLAGTEYFHDTGWHDISHNTPGTNSFDLVGTPNFEIDVQAYPTLEFRLAIYDVAGPYIDFGVALDANIAVPRNPFWQLDLIIQGSFGVRVRVLDLSLLDADLPIFNVTIPIAQSAVIDPFVSINSPHAGATFNAEEPILFDASAFDVQDGDPTVSWDSDVDGHIGNGKTVTAVLAGHQPGTRTITVTATNAEGGSSTATAQLFLAPRSPTAMILAPLPGDTIYAGQTYSVITRVSDHFSADPCTASGWTLSWTSSVATSAPLAGCAPQVTFMPAGSPTTAVPATLAFTAKDPWGGSVTATLNLSVQPPPPIQVTINSPTDFPPPTPSVTEMANSSLPAPLMLSATATDPLFPGDTLLYTWTAQAYDVMVAKGVQSLVSSGSPVSIGTGANVSWQVAGEPDAFLSKYGLAQSTGRPISVTCTVSDQHGQSVPGPAKRILFFYQAG